RPSASNKPGGSRFSLPSTTSKTQVRQDPSPPQSVGQRKPARVAAAMIVSPGSTSNSIPPGSTWTTVLMLGPLETTPRPGCSARQIIVDDPVAMGQALLLVTRETDHGPHPHAVLHSRQIANVLGDDRRPRVGVGVVNPLGLPERDVVRAGR